MDIFASVLLSSNLLLLYFLLSDAADSITQSQFINDSNGTNLVSKDGGLVLKGAYTQKKAKAQADQMPFFGINIIPVIII